MSKLNPEADPTVIEVCERGFIGIDGQPRFHAQMKGDARIWGQGISPAEAIGNALWSHAELFGLRVDYLEHVNR